MKNKTSKFFYKLMPVEEQNRLMKGGLEAMAKVLGENKFESLYSTWIRVNQI